jgi:stringent starvation protein B
MTSTRPYLLRAIHEWMLDNGLTPQIVVDANNDKVQVPRQFVEDGRIVLNIADSAVRHLSLGNDWVEFQARFSGSPFQIRVPIQHVLAVVARENGAGMSFSEEPDSEDDSTLDNDQPPPDDRPPTRPTLTVVK